jgi:catecholate siderophore receptor
MGMSKIKAPVSLRSYTMAAPRIIISDTNASGRVTLACLIAASSIGGAEAQQSPLPPVTIDAPITRPKPPSAKPSPEQIRARNALRRAARKKQPTVQQPVAPAPDPATVVAPNSNPYADPAAPYKANRVASSKFAQPILDTPKSITVLTKEVLEDKGATSIREAVRTTPGLTLGTGEGGNAFGDRFFIRGFDARNDVFIDGIRDPAVSIRENFFTEQIEILRGPASSFAGRGTAGGALNIVTKQAGDRNFYTAESTIGTDGTKRFTFDINQVISPTFSFRAGGMWQNADIAGRNYIYDDRWGGFLSTKWTPNDNLKVTFNYVHVDLDALPDFGVPYYRPSTATAAGGPFTEFGVPRGTFYGFVNRDFQKTTQDFGTLAAEYYVNDWVTLNTKFRAERSILNYIGTLPESPVITNPNRNLWTVSANPQSRYQTTDVLANQTDLTAKFMTGAWHNTMVGGFEISRESVTRDSYTGLTSEALPGGFSGSGSLVGVNIFNPTNNFLPFSTQPTLLGQPVFIPVDTKSVYLMDTANYRDLVILNGGIRYDDYNVSATNFQGSQSIQSGLVNWNAGITVKPLPFASVYAAYATSSNPVGAELDGRSAQYGGLAPFIAGNPTQVFGPERNKAAEIGTKWELFDRRLLATVALFRTEKDNAREAATVNGVAGTIVAGAAYQVQGIDIEVEGKITDKWSVFGGVVLMESKVTKSNVPPANLILYSTNVGLPLANIAHQSFNLLTKYRVFDRVEVGGQATYLSKIYGGTFLAANQGTSIPDHWRFDAFVEGRIDAHWTVKLAIYNIFNELYYDSLYQSATPFVAVAPGRSATLSLKATF